MEERKWLNLYFVDGIQLKLHVLSNRHAPFSFWDFLFIIWLVRVKRSNRYLVIRNDKVGQRLPVQATTDFILRNPDAVDLVRIHQWIANKILYSHFVTNWIECSLQLQDICRRTNMWVDSQCLLKLFLEYVLPKSTLHPLSESESKLNWVCINTQNKNDSEKEVPICKK